jgi:hypothetical protein
MSSSYFVVRDPAASLLPCAHWLPRAVTLPASVDALRIPLQHAREISDDTQAGPTGAARRE